MKALSENQELQLQLQQQKTFSQRQTGSWHPFRAPHTQPHMTAKRMEELEEARATAVEQVKSYKTLADGYKKDLEAERKRTWELKKELESLKAKPASSAMGAVVKEKVRVCTCITL